MIKKITLTILIITLIFSIDIFCFSSEKINYSVNFQKKSPEMAAVLHINFTNIPKLKTVEEILKQQLKIYGYMLISNKNTRKNIIGSAWHTNSNSKNFTKIKFQKDLAAYVWLGKIKQVVTFHDYINFLKKEKTYK
jgi:hypothetical protein